MNKIKRIWKNKTNILKGIWNKVFPKPSIEEIYQYRLELCRGCTYHDKDGTSENAVLKGEESCGICGCTLSFKLRVMEEKCALEEIGEYPLWTDEKRYKDEKEQY